jgi:hypothetical protein
VIEDRRLIATYYRDQHNFKDAARSVEQALSLSQTFNGTKSPETCLLMGMLADNYLKDKKAEKAGPLLRDAVEILHSEEMAKQIPRETKLHVLSTYANYLEQTGKKDKLEEIKAELNKV